MSDEEATAADSPGETKKKGLPAFVMPLVLVLAGLGGGGFVGAKVVGPRLTAGFNAGLTPIDLAAHAGKKKSHDGEADAEAGDEEGVDGEAAGDEEHAP